MRPMLNFAIITGLLLVLPAVSAQVINAQFGQFGTQVRVGDYDYVPLLKSSKSWSVAEFDAGIVGDVHDNCIVLVYDAHASVTGAFGPGSAHGVKVQNKDLRLSPCQGKPSGSLIADADVVEKQATYALYPAAGAAATLNAQAIASTPASANRFSFVYADVDGNGKYGKGDFVYLTAGTPTGSDLLVPSTGTGSWTLRLTAAGRFLAGSFVHLGDSDFTSFHEVAKNDKGWIVDEREDKAWYLMTTDSACCFNTVPPTTTSTLRAGTPLPANAIRLGGGLLAAAQPGITVTAAELANPDAVEVGSPLPVLVTATNTGSSVGSGLIVTKLDKQIVDVRVSPVLSPGETIRFVVTVPAVLHSGPQELEVNDVFLPMAAQGDAGDAALDPQDLQAQIVQLQHRLETLEETRSETLQKQGASSLSPLAAMACIGSLVILLRRRQD